jgi:ubiquinone/menaquinone biosynthesis C-methylase UbiE
MPGIFFWGMTALFKIRDWFKPREVLLDEVPLKTGDTVLDYGCGPGSYIPALSARVGETGTVIAMDIHPLAVQRVEALAKRRGLSNVGAQLTDGVHLDSLADGSVDVVLLCDVFHMLGDQVGVLVELQRVLRPNSVLIVNDPHMDRDDLVAGVTRTGDFRLAKRGAHVTVFAPTASTDDRGALL